MSEYWQALRSFSLSMRRFLLAMALMASVGFGMLAVLQNLFLLRLGFDARFIGLMSGLGQLAWAAAALPAGILSNRIGLRNGLLAGMGLFGLALVLILLVESRPESLWRAWILGSQVVLNLGAAFISVNIPPYLMALTGERERRHAFASHQALIPAMTFAGSIVAGVLPGLLAARLSLTLDQPAPYRLALWLGPAVIALGMLPLWAADRAQMVQQQTRQARAERAPLGLLAWFGGVAFLGAIGEGTVRTFFNVYLDTGLDVPPAAIGAIMGMAQLLPVAVALSVPLLLARWGAGYTMATGMLGIAFCLVPLGVAPLIGVAALAYMGIISSMTIASTARDMFGQELVAPQWRTSSQGAAIVGLSLGWSTVGILGGVLVQEMGFGALYLVGALASLAGVLLLVGYLRAARRPPAPAGTAP